MAQWRRGEGGAGEAGGLQARSVSLKKIFKKNKSKRDPRWEAVMRGRGGVCTAAPTWSLEGGPLCLNIQTEHEALSHY